MLLQSIFLKAHGTGEHVESLGIPFLVESGSYLEEKYVGFITIGIAKPYCETLFERGALKMCKIMQKYIGDKAMPETKDKGRPKTKCVFSH